MIELLDLRQMCSVALSGNVVSIVGTENVDALFVSQETTAKGKRVYQFSLNGEIFQFGRSAVQRLDISLLGGSDVAILGRIPVPALMQGGSGNDILSAGDGNDTIYGQGGSDILVGRFGGDILDGGAQGDILNASAGDDTLFAGSSASSDDSIFGGAGKDTLRYASENAGILLQIGDGSQRARFCGRCV